MTTTAQQIKASDIQAGMIVTIHGGTQQVPVAEAVAKCGALQITDGNGRWYGLGENETVTIVGHFNL